MGSYPPGTVLTCIHEGCPCRARVEVECHCPDAGGPYRCTCGAEMVAVEDPTGATAAP
jgi:metallothionein